MAHSIGLPLTPVDVLPVAVSVLLLVASGHLLWRRGRGGKILLTLRRPDYAWLYGALAVAFAAVLLARLLDPRLRQPSMLVLNLAWVAFCLAYLAHRPGVRERGIAAGALFLPWERIESYTVDTTQKRNRRRPDALLTVHYHLSRASSTSTRSTTIRCASAKRPEIELLLARHMRTEQGHRRWQARRVGVLDPGCAVPTKDPRRAHEQPPLRAQRSGVARSATRRQAMRPAP